MGGSGQRRRPALVVVVGLALAAGLLGACSSSGGQALAEQACVHVHHTVASLRTKADSQLRAALPLAAAANSDDGSWNSLMTTISESATVDEGHLLPSLEAQCAVADTNINVNPQSPGG